MPITLQDVVAAQRRIDAFVHHTPIFTSETLNALTKSQLFFKCENFQKIGAFKIRGACNAVFQLPDEIAKHGVTTHSSGNHGAAIALAAKIRGIPAYIVMPNNSPQVKQKAVASYGARITYCEPTMQSRQATLDKIVLETNATFLHPFDNENIIAGQGTVGLEFLNDCPNLDMMVVPIGGGGLISGISIVAKELAPKTAIIGAEPLLANDTYTIFKNQPELLNTQGTTICDGLLTPAGKLTLPIIMSNVADIFTAKEATIIEATKYFWERMKIIVEPSAAVTLAILLDYPEVFANKTIGLVLSGGNVDVKQMADLMYK